MSKASIRCWQAFMLCMLFLHRPEVGIIVHALDAYGKTATISGPLLGPEDRKLLHKCTALSQKVVPWEISGACIKKQSFISLICSNFAR